MKLRRLVGLPSLLLILLLGCGAPDPGPADHDTALRRLAAQLAAGQDAAAIGDLRTYLEQAPDDAGMHYNLACLLARGGELDAAAGSLRQALACGYTRLDQLRNDPDLAGLQADDRLTTIVTEHEDRLRERAATRALRLDGEAWSAPLDLGHGSTVRLRLGPDALQVDLAGAGTIDGGWLTVTVPDDPEAYDTTRWWEFSLSRDDGVLTALPPTHLDGQVLALPWRALVPHRPPLDLVFGWNLVLDTAHGRASLVDDPAIGRHTGARRRFATVAMDPAESATPLLVGRPDSRLVVGDTLSVELAVQGVPDGDVPVRLSSSDGAEATLTVPVGWGLGYTTALLTTTGAPPGWVDLEARAPDADLAWQGRIFRLTSDWFRTRNQQLAAINGPQQDLVRFWLFRVLRGQQTSDPRDDPAPLAAAVARTDALLERWRTTGSVLPTAAGVEAVGVRVARDILVEARLRLPAAEQRQGNLPARLILVDETTDLDTTPALPAVDKVELVIPLPPVPGNDTATTAQVHAARQWLIDLIPGVDTLILEGRGRSANTALLAAAADPSAWSHLELHADHTLDPWPLVATDELATHLTPELIALVTTATVTTDGGVRARTVVRGLLGE